MTVAPRCDGRSCDESATSLRRSARPAPHARRVRKVALCGGCAVWRGARVWGERPGARGSRARPVRTAQALALPPARTAAIQVPMDQMRPLTRPRTVAGRAIGARRRAFPSRWQKRATGVAVASQEMVVRDCGDGDEGLRYLPLESAGMRRAAPCMARCVRHAVRAATRRLPGVVVYASCLCWFAVVGMVAGWDHVVPSRRC